MNSITRTVPVFDPEKCETFFDSSSYCSVMNLPPEIWLLRTLNETTCRDFNPSFAKQYAAEPLADRASQTASIPATKANLVNIWEYSETLPQGSSLIAVCRSRGGRPEIFDKYGVIVGARYPVIDLGTHEAQRDFGCCLLTQIDDQQSGVTQIET